MQGDRRQIQTAVLGSADSQEPLLLLPLEAIELDAFRRQHGDDTFWCGIWLGGCGRQLTTKLYTDQVCQLRPPRRHRPAPGPRCDQCRSPLRESRRRTAPPGPGADGPGGVLGARRGPAGSLVQLHLGDGQSLTIHMNTAVTPDWDRPPGRTVIADRVPADRRTLQRLPYVHRIRCESDGTSRRVLIGTQTTRGTQWYRTELTRATLLHARMAPPRTR